MSGPADQPREFYERYVEEHVPYHRSPRGLKRLILSVLPYGSYREWRFWARWVPISCRLLDLGCARGREVFRERASFVVGVDLARNALSDCVGNYDGALEASRNARRRRGGTLSTRRRAVCDDGVTEALIQCREGFWQGGSPIRFGILQ